MFGINGETADSHVVYANPPYGQSDPPKGFFTKQFFGQPHLRVNRKQEDSQKESDAYPSPFFAILDCKHKINKQHTDEKHWSRIT